MEDKQELAQRSSSGGGKGYSVIPHASGLSIWLLGQIQEHFGEKGKRLIEGCSVHGENHYDRLLDEIVSFFWPSWICTQSRASRTSQSCCR